MNLGIIDEKIPGTVLSKKDMGGVTGLKFLDTIYFITNGIMLSQIRGISGIDGSTLQNWIKRGWVANSINKRYDIDQLARILIINMLRESMQLEKISFLLKYISINTHNNSNIIRESKLYDYICKIIDAIIENDNTNNEQLQHYICECTSDYIEDFPGGKLRLIKALEIIIITYYASSIKLHSCNLMKNIENLGRM